MRNPTTTAIIWKPTVSFILFFHSQRLCQLLITQKLIFLKKVRDESLLFNIFLLEK